MRIIKRKTLLDFAAKHPPARQPLLAWYAEVSRSTWSRPNEIKRSFRTADVIDTKRVVFNIKGNSYRLVVDVEYRIGLVFIVRVMTHAEYDKVDVRTIRHEG
ncbi:MAG: type II toxin-antitoxin system HigB family toxin [Flavobacteriales bacterium]|nr:type II toxin-antitoxin system HigB family toxin [Flavobacteriales bacterium]